MKLHWIFIMLAGVCWITFVVMISRVPKVEPTPQNEYQKLYSRCVLRKITESEAISECDNIKKENFN